jgi:hypothetical protein
MLTPNSMHALEGDSERRIIAETTHREMGYEFKRQARSFFYDLLLTLSEKLLYLM